jgi:hypothetical protein
MSVAATGTNLTYQWKLNGTSLTTSSTYTGVQSNTLTINNPSTTLNGGYYTCVVSGYCTPSVSSTIDTLWVNGLPGISTQPSNTVVCNGSNTTISIATTGAGITYQWRADTGTGPYNLSNGVLYGGVTSNSLTISGATLNMNGYHYSCVVSGTCSPAVTSNSVLLTVNSLPTITVQPATRNQICAGSNTTMNVTATGTGISYQWKLNGSIITPSTTYTGTTTNTLSINGATAGMNGYVYTCTVSGTCLPSVTSTNDTLGVNLLPAISSQPSNFTTCAGGNASFTVGATGAGLQYVWKENGVTLTNGGVYGGVCCWGWGGWDWR